MSGLDGQFVAVTLAALWGGWVLLRPLLSLRGKKKAAGPASACGHCAAGSSCAAKRAAGGETLITLGTRPKPR